MSMTMLATSGDEGRAVARGERAGLGDEPRSRRGHRHQEHRADDGAAG
jgi:hypothetical protein